MGDSHSSEYGNVPAFLEKFVNTENSQDSGTAIPKSAFDSRMPDENEEAATENQHVFDEEEPAASATTIGKDEQQKPNSVETDDPVGGSEEAVRKEQEIPVSDSIKGDSNERQESHEPRIEPSTASDTAEGDQRNGTEGTNSTVSDSDQDKMEAETSDMTTIPKEKHEELEQDNDSDELSEPLSSTQKIPNEEDEVGTRSDAETPIEAPAQGSWIPKEQRKKKGKGKKKTENALDNAIPLPSGIPSVGTSIGVSLQEAVILRKNKEADDDKALLDALAGQDFDKLSNGMGVVPISADEIMNSSMYQQDVRHDDGSPLLTILLGFVFALLIFAMTRLWSNWHIDAVAEEPQRVESSTSDFSDAIKDSAKNVVGVSVKRGDETISYTSGVVISENGTIVCPYMDTFDDSAMTFRATDGAVLSHISRKIDVSVPDGLAAFVADGWSGGNISQTDETTPDGSVWVVSLPQAAPERLFVHGELMSGEDAVALGAKTVDEANNLFGGAVIGTDGKLIGIVDGIDGMNASFAKLDD